MATPIAMPKLGITMEEGTVVEWPLAVGEPVAKGQVVLIIESEKAEVEIEAAAGGFVRHYFAEPGDTLPCGALLGAITETADESFDPDGFEAEEAAKAPADEPKAAPASAASPISLRQTTRAAPRLGRRSATPAARVRAKTLGLDVLRVPGTGPHGRITRRDVDDYAERRRQLVSVADGVALDVPRQGTGVPLLLLPGLGTDVSAFAPQIPALAEQFQVLGVNPRGVAGSDAPDADVYTVATAAGDAAAVVSHVGAGPAHVVGASLGAAAALEMALTRPEHVKTLTLLTPFVAADARLEMVSDAWCRQAAGLAPEDLARSLLPWFFSPAFLSNAPALRRTLRGLTSTVARVPAATLERAVAGLRAWSGTRGDDLAGLQVPTLVVAAGGDLLTPEAERIAERIPNATSVIVPDAGHALTIEAPEAVTEAVLAHVSAQR